MGRDVAEEANMSTKATNRLVREGDLVAEVDVDLIEGEGGWAPYLSLDDSRTAISGLIPALPFKCQTASCG